MPTPERRRLPMPRPPAALLGMPLAPPPALALQLELLGALLQQNHGASPACDLRPHPLARSRKKSSPAPAEIRPAPARAHAAREPAPLPVQLVGLQHQPCLARRLPRVVLSSAQGEACARRGGRNGMLHFPRPSAAAALSAHCNEIKIFTTWSFFAAIFSIFAAIVSVFSCIFALSPRMRTQAASPSNCNYTPQWRTSPLRVSHVRHRERLKGGGGPRLA